MIMSRVDTRTDLGAVRESGPIAPALSGARLRVRVWVDRQSFLVRRFEILEENETIRTVILDELQPNAPIPDSVFQFVPPADADVFEG